jgi:hypothetical protein
MVHLPYFFGHQIADGATLTQAIASGLAFEPLGLAAEQRSSASQGNGALEGHQAANECRLRPV